MAQKLDEFSMKHGDEGVYEMEFAWRLRKHYRAGLHVCCCGSAEVGSRTVVCCSWDAMSVVLKGRPFKVTKGWVASQDPLA